MKLTGSKGDRIGAEVLDAIVYSVTPHDRGTRKIS
jgi:hypothetical protein